MAFPGWNGAARLYCWLEQTAELIQPMYKMPKPESESNCQGETSRGVTALGSTLAIWVRGTASRMARAGASSGSSSAGSAATTVLTTSGPGSTPAGRSLRMPDSTAGDALRLGPGGSQNGGSGSGKFPAVPRRHRRRSSEGWRVLVTAPPAHQPGGL